MPGLRRRQLARLGEEDAEIEVALRQGAAEFRDGAVVVGQLLPDRKGLPKLGLRLLWLACLPQ